MRKLLTSLSLLLVCLIGAGASATTIAASDDAFVESFFPTLAQGGDTTVTSSNLSSITPADISRIYLKFTMPTFQAGTSVSSASITAFLETGVDFGGLVYGISVASSDAWDEGTITWNNQPGIGAATGAIFDPTGVADGSSVIIPGLAAAADAAYQGDGVLSLVMFISDESQLLCNLDCPIVVFTSNEGGNGATIDIAVIPEPSTAALMAFGLAGLAIARRKVAPAR